MDLFLIFINQYTADIKGISYICCIHLHIGKVSVFAWGLASGLRNNIVIRCHSSLDGKTSGEVYCDLPRPFAEAV